VGSSRRADPVLGGQQVMETLLIGIMIGFIIGYPVGLFIDKLDKREKAKNGGR